ncbi:hypothetical protein N7478_007770 [Penicillium angulare]|uniref:uncharacterized protein n=1 Tax=Penicillium angulare TaxID=116970 RepID=UPI00253FD189|nr:uncharacterized protein N7478_007770 [Penicillium angulare]KAJ5272645.1 hypothetical protein N7478_007770 [Penicillium angulare]
MPPKKKSKIRNSTDNSVSLLNNIHTPKSQRNTKNRRHTTHGHVFDLPASPEKPQRSGLLEERQALLSRLRSSQKIPSIPESAQSDEEQQEMPEPPEQSESPAPPEETQTLRSRLRSANRGPLVPEMLPPPHNAQRAPPTEDERMDDASDPESHDEDVPEVNGSTAAYQGSDMDEDEDEVAHQLEEQLRTPQNGMREEEEQEHGEQEDEQEQEEGEERFSTPPLTVSPNVSRERPELTGTTGNDSTNDPLMSMEDSQAGSSLFEYDSPEITSPHPQMNTPPRAYERQESMEDGFESENMPDDESDAPDAPEYVPGTEPEDEPEDDDIARLDPDLKDWLVKTVQTTDPKRQWMDFHERAFVLPDYVRKPTPTLFEDSLMLLARAQEIYTELEYQSVDDGLPSGFQADIANLCTSTFAEIQGILNFPSLPDAKQNPVKAGKLVVQVEGYLLPHMAVLVILGFKAFAEYGIPATKPFAVILKLLRDSCERINDLRDYYVSASNRQRSWKLGVSTKQIQTALESGSLNVHLPAGSDEDTDTMPSLLWQWTNAEVVALRHALQTYRRQYSSAPPI